MLLSRTASDTDTIMLSRKRIVIGRAAWYCGGLTPANWIRGRGLAV